MKPTILLIRVRAFFYPTNGNTPIFSDFSNVVTLTTPNRPTEVLTAGRVIRYRAQIEVPNGNLSNPVQDFIHSTHRDPNGPSPVRITRVEHDGSIEDWWRGSPEFVLTLLMVNRASGHHTPIVVQQNIRLDFPVRPLGIGNTRTANFNVPLLSDWDTRFFYDMLTFHVIESNGRGTWNFDISAEFRVKSSEEARLLPGATATARITYNNNERNSTEVGRTFYSFYQPTEHWLEFPVGGVRIRLNE